ncbi:RNA-dependent RNA polymerase [Theobroma cacao]|nr:RNA-dependent RNA polymerase [Theobroma cacao]
MDLELETLHYMAVDFAKTRAPTEMPRSLKPEEFPDFMQRVDKPMEAYMGLSTLCMKSGNSLGFRDQGISAGAPVFAKSTAIK